MSDALDLALSEVEKKYGKGSIINLADTNSVNGEEWIPTGSYALDEATGGGIPRGRIIEIYGVESAGKTTLLQSIIANAQRLGGRCAIIDAEHALDRDYLARCGCDINRLWISQPDSGEQALDIAEILVRSGEFAVVGVDSVAALVPDAELAGEMSDSHIGLQARLMGKALRKLAGPVHKAKTALIFTNQLREKIGVVYGCFQYNTRVVLADGSKMKIGKIVNNKLPVDVLAYNQETGQFEAKRVVNWFRNGNADEFLQFKVKSGHNGWRQFACTSNHPILTEHGYVQAGQLKAGDDVLTVVPHYLSDRLREIVIGSLFGDGQIRKASKTGMYSRMRIGHGVKQYDYCDWKRSLFGELAYHEYEYKPCGKGFSTIPMYELEVLRQRNYNSGRKSISPETVNDLTPFAVAIWYMDDGTFCQTKGRASIACGDIRPETIEPLINWFREHGIEAKWRSVKKGRLEFSRIESRKLHSMLAPYIHPSMDYKIAHEYRGRFNVEQPLPYERLEATPMQIESIYVKPRTKSMVRFDIEVEGHHNYLADGVVVHNSPEVTPGGRALRFYASLRLEVRRGEPVKRGNEIVGAVAKIKVTKNKLASPFRTVELDIIYGEGISREASLIEYAVSKGVVKKAGAFYSFEETRLGQGRDNAREFLRENPELTERIESLVRNKVRGE